MRRLLVWSGVAILAGCSFDRSGVAPVSDQGPRSDVGDQRIWLPGEGGPPADLWPAPPDGANVPCAGLSCPLGCNTALNRCFRVKPTGYPVNGFFDNITGAVNGAAGELLIDTTTGEIRAGATVIRQAGPPGAVVNGIYFGVTTQSAGYPGVAVFGMASFDVPPGGKAVVQGQRALSIYATGDVNIGGELLAPATKSMPGPGGFAGGAENGAQAAACFGGEGKGGGQSGVNPNEIEAGGGGGGRGALGGAGGKAINNYYSAAGGTGGATVGDPALWPLFGGCGGGAGGGPDTGTMAPSAGGHGGGGGGAIQIAANGAITVSGVVAVPGAGGGGGIGGSGGGGGGAGGAILLEATAVNLSGVLAANGGGGGAGASGIGMSSKNGQPGQDGPLEPVRASGGPDNPSWGGAGGQGGALPETRGAHGANDANAGGGGGAAGMVRVNAKGASMQGQVSPAALAGQPAVW